MPYDMSSNVKSIAVDPELCFESRCHESCEHSSCDMCSSCAADIDLQNMRIAHREHVRSEGFKRIYPTVAHFEEDFISNVTIRDQISIEWFRSKCLVDSEWC